MLSVFWSNCNPRNGSFCEDRVSSEACVYHRLLLINQISFNVQNISREMKQWLCGGLTPACVTVIDLSLHSAWTWNKGRTWMQREQKGVTFAVSSFRVASAAQSDRSRQFLDLCILCCTVKQEGPTSCQDDTQSEQHQNMYGSKSE